LEVVTDRDQYVDQVMCAAVNIYQGRTGSDNSRTPFVESKCRFVLDLAYQGTYLGAILHNRTQIVLTMVGGGIFGNKKEWIFDSIIKAHQKWGIEGRSSLKRVTLILFNPRDLHADFLNRLQKFGHVRVEKMEADPNYVEDLQ